MAKLYITSFAGAVEVALGDPVQKLEVTFTTSTQSTALTSPTNEKHKLRVRIMADADCFINYVDSNPTATDGTDSIALGSNNPEYFSIDSGRKIAAVTRS